MDISEDVLQRLQSRRDGHFMWLMQNAPEIFTEQRHIEEGADERYYWHFGYAMALDDFLATFCRIPRWREWQGKGEVNVD